MTARPAGSALDGASFRPDQVARFRYLGYEFDPVARTLRSRYALDDLTFDETVTFDTPASTDVDRDALDPALRLVHLLSGVSYFKAAAPPVIEVPEPDRKSVV